MFIGEGLETITKPSLTGETLWEVQIRDMGGEARRPRFWCLPPLRPLKQPNFTMGEGSYNHNALNGEPYPIQNLHHRPPCTCILRGASNSERLSKDFPFISISTTKNKHKLG